MCRRSNHNKAIILGGAGFIGSHFASYLIKKDFEVLIYDSFTQYISPESSQYSDFVKKRLPDCRIVRGFLENKRLLQETVKEFNPNYIINLASPPMSDISAVHSEECFSGIVAGNVNCLESISKLDRYLFVSSSMVYGNFQQFPCPENHPKIPLDLYGGFKYAGETITSTYCRLKNIPWTIVRPSSVYGEFDCNYRLWQSVIEHAIKEKPVTVKHDHYLDFTYIDDLISGLYLALTCDQSVDQIYNITRGEGRLIEDGIDFLKQIFPSLKCDIIYENNPNRPIRGALDISKAKNELGYDPQYSLEQGLDRYACWYSNS